MRVYVRARVFACARMCVRVRSIYVVYTYVCISYFFSLLIGIYHITGVHDDLLFLFFKFTNYESLVFHLSTFRDILLIIFLEAQ